MAFRHHLAASAAFAVAAFATADEPVWAELSGVERPPLAVSARAAAAHAYDTRRASRVSSQATDVKKPGFMIIVR